MERITVIKIIFLGNMFRTANRYKSQCYQLVLSDPFMSNKGSAAEFYVLCHPKFPVMLVCSKNLDYFPQAIMPV